MENTFNVILSRQGVLTRQLQTIATNLANANTAGFKAEVMIFKEYKEPIGETGGSLSMVHDVTYLRDMSQGEIKGTDNPLDMAISGEGFFVVEAPQGERYTRHGAFQLDNTGQLTTLTGAPVLGAGGAPIVVPPGTERVTVTRDGTFSADGQEIGKLQVVTFDAPHALFKDGTSLYNAKEQEPRAAPEAEILQGMIEGSNVKGVVEMTRMIEVTRSYQSATRMAETEHQRIRRALDTIIGRA